jgi:hypothetical protein
VVLARVARGGCRRTVGPLAADGAQDPNGWGKGHAGRRGPGACGPFAVLGKCLALSSASGLRLNAPEERLP